MSSGDIVHDLDMKYSGEGAIDCPNEGKAYYLPQSKSTGTYHGKMGVHGSGAFLVCGACDAKLPTARI